MEHITINSDRSVTVPVELRKIGVQYDHNVNTIEFVGPRYSGNVDLSTMTIYINYILSDKTPGKYKAENVIIDDQDDSLIRFNWTITRNVTKVYGILSCLICAKKTDEEGNEINHWNTDIFRLLSVSEGMENDLVIQEQYPDVITSLIQNIEEHDVKLLEFSGLNIRVTDLENNVDLLKGDISDYVGVTEMEFSDPTLCQYINTGVAVGSVIDWSIPSVSSGGTKIKWCAVECTGGDVFRISAKGGNADRAWAFCDIDKRLIINSNIQADVTNLKLIAPQNAKWIIVNDEQDRRSYIGGFVSDKLDEITDNLLNANVNNNSIKMKKLEGVSYTEGINLISGAYSNKVIESNGTFSDSSAYCLYDEAVEVKNGDILYRLNNSSYSFIGAYRADGTFTRSALQSGLSSYIVNFDGYVRLCDSKDLSTLQVWSKTPVTEYVPHETSYDFSDNPLYKACISGLASKYPKLKGKKWLFMGDSITQGINTPVNSSYFAKSIEYSGAIGTNKGIGGSCISNGRFSSQEETSILTLSSITNTSNPHYIDFENYDILTIFAGTNDWGFDIGVPTDFPTTGDSSYGKTVCGSLNVALKNIQMRNPNLKIIVITPMFRSRYNTGDGMNSDEHSLRLTYSEEIFDDNGYYLYDMADKIEELCKLNHVPCFNMYRNLQVTKYNSDTYLADGVHPTLKGSEYLANRICQFVSDNCGL